MKMRRCVIPTAQTDAGSSQKHFLRFRVLHNVGIDPLEKIYFLALFREDLIFRFPAKTILA